MCIYRWVLYANPTYQHVKNPSGFKNENLFSIAVGATYYVDAYSFDLSGWVGRERYGVHKDGFVVYNFGEERKGGMSGQVGYAFTPTISGTLDASWSRVKERSTGKVLNYGALTLGVRAQI